MKKCGDNMIFNGTKELETKRLLLRKIEPGDYKVAYKEWCSDLEQVKYTIHGIHKSEEVTKSVYDKWIQEYNDPKTLRWMIVLKDTNEPIGTIDINNTWSKYGCVEPGYIIARKYWGHGYATEATMAVMNYLFDECDVQTIYSEFMEDNIASGRVMQKCGMVQEGRLRNRCEDKTGKRQDLLSCSITRDEFYEKFKGGNIHERK